jgi:hypothetical protein
MSQIYKVILLGFSALAALACAGVANASSLPKFSPPGVPEPGYPDFAALNFAASLQGSSQSGYILTIAGGDPNFGMFNFPKGSYGVGGEEIELTAHFSATGQLLKNQPNTIEIFGSLPGSNSPSAGSAPKGYSWSKQPFELLFEAVLTGFAVDSKHEALGFSTKDFSGWADQLQFTGNKNPIESLWLYSVSTGNPFGGFGGGDWNQFLTDLKDHKSLQAAKFYGIGSIATVPLPASGLLMLGGLAGLGALMVRRRRVEAGPPASTAG